MKNVIILMVMFISLFFVSCGDSDGNSGDTGDTGNSGNTGNTGNTGDSSDTGNSGDSGNSGNTGDTGNTGDSGNTGNSGNSGNTGNTGNTGDSGNTGNTSFECENGEKKLGETLCEENKGKLYQICEEGKWVDTEECFVCNPGNYPNVCGHYAQKMWFTAASKVATINMAEAWTRTYFHLIQEQDQDKVFIKAKICTIKIDNTMRTMLAMNMPQSFADALPWLNKESTLVDKGDGTFGFEQDTFWEIRSIDPACYGDNPANYKLPTKEKDACVQDWDNDTIPGLLVNASGSMGGWVHIVEKSSSKFENGWFDADGKKAGGDIFWTDAQEVLKASSSTLMMGADNKWKEKSDKFSGSANFFEQFKIPEGSDCTYIVQNASTIFNADPVKID